MIIDADIPYNKNSLKKKFYHLKLFSVQNACQSFPGVDACHTSLRCKTDSTLFCFLETRLVMNTDSFLQSSIKVLIWEMKYTILSSSARCHSLILKLHMFTN